MTQRYRLKKGLLMSFLSIVVMTIIIVGSSYALFMGIKSNNNDQILTVGDLQITFSGGSVIEVDNILPMTDAIALTKNDNLYTFTVDNLGDLAYCYDIKLANDPIYLEGGQMYDASKKLLSFNYLRYKLDNENAMTLGDQSEGIIFSGIVNAGVAKVFNLRLWVGDAVTYNLPNEALGSEIHLIINVDGKACTEGGFVENEIESE